MKIQRGFSLIEVVVTIAIMGILMASAMPSVGDWIRNSKVRNAAESIQNGLQQARMEAVRRNRPVSFYLVSTVDSSCALSSSSGSWVVSIESPVGKCDVNASTTDAPKLVAKAAVSDGGRATVSATQFNGTTAANVVTFNGFGMVTNADAIRRITASSSGGSTTYARRVELSTGGIARLCDPSVSTTSDARACTATATQ